jgi:SAM-dependent methyltransferase
MKNNQRRLRKTKFQKRRKLFAGPNRVVEMAEQNPRYCPTARTLAQIEKIHGIDFKKEIRTLQRRFPRQVIEVLDAGSGESTFAAELTSDRVRVHRSDIRDIGGNDFHQVSTNRLLERLGPNRFHLVVETTGGTHKGGSFPTALANIYSVLKPGGKAIIVATQHARIEMPLFVRLVRRLGITHKVVGETLILYK